VYQIVATTSTSTYPFKFFSVASTTKSSINWATSTEYVFNGDTLLATIDQQFKNGTATGTAKTRYVHPDHLGSTNVVTDENDSVVQTLDYYPYGGARISSSTSTNEKRKFIGQFTDASGLDYLNARYYSSDRGQFISQDPVFWEIGITQDGTNALSNPQALNSYGYANDNPITGKDPSGRQLATAFEVAAEVTSSAPAWVSAAGSALSSWSGSIAAGTGAAILYINSGYNGVAQKAQNYNNNRKGGTRFIPFNQQGREVRPPNKDPEDPFNGWQIAVGAGTIAAAELITDLRNMPSNKILPTSEWRPLAPIPFQGTSQQNNNTGRSSASYDAQIKSIQAQINQIQAKINAIQQSRSTNKL
jgi:RHS repeat-associated protein